MERIGNIPKTLLGFGLFTILTNMITIISTNQYNLIPLYVAPFVVVSLVLLIFRKNGKIISAELISLLGLIMCFVGEKSSATGAAFIFYACYLNENRNKTIIRLLVMTVCIALKGTIMEINASQTINFLALHYFILALGYQIFTKKKKITITEIEDQTEQIMQYVIGGKRNKEIAAMTFMSEAAVQKRIKRLMIKENCETLPQLVFKLYGNRQQGKKIDRFKIV